MRAGDGEQSEWRGSQGGKDEFTVIVARTPFAWRALWDGIGEAAPVALETDGPMALAVFLGRRRTGGFGVLIESLERRGAFMVATVKEIRPAPDAMVTQALTSPYLVRLIARTEFPVAVERLEGADEGLFVPASEARVLEDLIALTEREAREADTTIRLLEARLESLRAVLERLRAGASED